MKNGASRRRARGNRGWVRALGAVALVACALPGCSTVEYYWQGIAGQVDVLSRRTPMSEIVLTTHDEVLKDRLVKVQSIRAFASGHLGLPNNGSYTTYADIGRPYVVWNVFAAPALSLRPRESCFPVVGCVAYRGYFSEAEARASAAQYAASGDDVYVGGVPAYSTLGYFDDPVLSSFIKYRETEMARLLFHELAHQMVYAKDDSSFNESFAVAVEEEGVKRWLAAQKHRPDGAELAAEAARSRQLREDFRKLVRDTRDQLEAVYASSAPDAEKLAAKGAVIEAMHAEYERLKFGWGGSPAYDRWIASAANNAGIAAVGLYDDKVPLFTALLAAEGGNLPRFYEAAKALAVLPKAERAPALAAAAHRMAIVGGGTHAAVRGVDNPAARGHALDLERKTQ